MANSPPAFNNRSIDTNNSSRLSASLCMARFLLLESLFRSLLKKGGFVIMKSYKSPTLYFMIFSLIRSTLSFHGEALKLVAASFAASLSISTASICASFVFCATINVSKPVPAPMSNTLLQSPTLSATQAPKRQASVVTFMAQYRWCIKNCLN